MRNIVDLFAAKAAVAQLSSSYQAIFTLYVVDVLWNKGARCRSASQRSINEQNGEQLRPKSP